MNPLIKNISLGAGGLVAAVAIYFGAITAGNYSGVILSHLVDIIQGSTANTVVSYNSPGWGIGTPLAQPIIASNATTTGSLASSTPYTFAVAALDGNGTTTLSSTVTVTTDASSTGNPAEGVQLTWPSVSGARGYAIYFATSSNAKAASLNQYFLATSTNGYPNAYYTFATSTGSIAGTNTLTDSTAFSNRIIAGLLSYFNGGNVGIASTTFNGLLGLGDDSNTTNGSTTVSAGKLQFDGYTTGGHRICVFWNDTGIATSTGACNQ